MNWKIYIAFILCMSSFFWSGCKEKDQQSPPAADIDNKDIVCPMLYQKNDSIENALVFIEAPEDKLESYISSVKKKGELVNRKKLRIANKLFSLSISKDADFYISLLSEKTKEQLKDDNKNE